MRQLVLIRETGRRNGFQASEEVPVSIVPLGDGVERVFVQLVVVAIIAEGGGALRKVPEIGLVLLIKKRVLGGKAVGDWFEILGQNGPSDSKQDKQAPVNTHSACRLPEHAGKNAVGLVFPRESLILVSVKTNESAPFVDFRRVGIRAAEFDGLIARESETLTLRQAPLARLSQAASERF